MGWAREERGAALKSHHRSQGSHQEEGRGRKKHS